ncbi:MAG TPA: DUF3261 domain-containing protein [Tepidisphaeraceae bacterium]|nr:DUF3261 domain-containing protein [Tepidisphaeraceae bacterium]
MKEFTTLSRRVRTASKGLIGPMILIALLGGCAQEPFVRPPLPVLSGVDPQAIRENFPRRLPRQFTSEDSVVIQAPFRDDLAVLAVLKVDRSAKTFRLLGLHQMGITIFDVGGDHDGLTVNSAIPPLMEHRDVLLSIARDIRRMYFDLSPGAAATVQVRPTRVLFEQKTPAGTLEYQFGDKPCVLLEKRLAGLFGTIWRVRYYDYRPGAGGKLYPRGIVMDNGRYHYRIIVKNRDWSVEPS